MAKKTYDFSAFDKKPAEKQAYDFSAFEGENQRDPAAVSGEDSIADTLADAGRGAIQGATFGFGDEIAGGLGATREVLTGDSTLEKFMDAYRKNRDESRVKFDQAAERSPTANTIGNLAGGVGAGLLTAGAGSAASGAGALARMINAAKAGAAAGGIAGIGSSEGDLTSGELADAGQVGKDALGGVAMGGLFGGGLSAGATAAKATGKGIGKIATKVGDSIADTEIGQNLSKAYKYGKEGVDLVTTKGRELAEQGLEAAGIKLGTTANQINKEQGAALGALRKKLEKAGVKVNIKDDLDAIQAVIKQLEKSADAQKRGDAAYLQNYLDDLLQGVEQDVSHTRYTPAQAKEMAATPSGRQKLEEEAARLAEQARLAGENPKFNIQESPDKKFISLLKATDEQVGGAERANPILDMDGNPTGQHSLDAGNPADNFNTGLKVKTIQNTEGTPAYTENVPAQIGNEVTEKVRSGGGLTGGFDQATDVNSTLTNLSRVGQNSKLNSNEALNVVGTSAKNIKGKLLNPDVAGSQADEALGQQFAKTNTQTAASYQALDTLGLDASDFTMNPVTKTLELDNKAVLKLMDTVRKEAAEGTAGVKGRRTLNKALEMLEAADPEKAKALRPMIERNAEIFDLSQKGQNLGLLNKSTYTKAGTIQVANRVGSGMKALSDATPESLKVMAQHFMNQGGSKMKIVQPLIEAMKKDNVGRNAALFALQQNPDYRKMLNEYLGNEEKDK